MSGGSYDYAYHRVEALADEINDRTADPKRLAFAGLLYECAKAARDIEWVDSGDKAPGDEHEAIEAALNVSGADLAVQALGDQVDELERRVNEVRAWIGAPR